MIFNRNKRDLADKELALYKREQIVSLEEGIQSRKNQMYDDLFVLRKKFIDDCKYINEEHSSYREIKNVELAKLDGEIMAKRIIIRKEDEYRGAFADATTQRAIAESRLQEIILLKELLKRADENEKVIITKLSKVDVDKIAVSVGPVNATK